MICYYTHCQDVAAAGLDQQETATTDDLEGSGADGGASDLLSLSSVDNGAMMTNYPHSSNRERRRPSSVPDGQKWRNTAASVTPQSPSHTTTMKSSSRNDSSLYIFRTRHMLWACLGSLESPSKSAHDGYGVCGPPRRRPKARADMRFAESNLCRS